MAYDEKTPHLSLPLPHPRNTLREDCPRIRESLQALDLFAEKSDAAVAALAEADTTLANAMQSQGKDLAEAISQEEQARSQADSGHDNAIAALKKQIEALQETVAKINPWDIFPMRVPIAVDGVKFGGSDGRRAIMPGETEPRENWVLCDGGEDGHGGTVPDMRGRVVLGASEAHPAGSAGGSETHEHGLAGTVGETTLSTEQMPAHGHSYTFRSASRDCGYASGSPMFWQNTTTANTGNAGGGQAHTHPLTGSIEASETLPPFHSFTVVMRCA